MSRRKKPKGVAELLPSGGHKGSIGVWDDDDHAWTDAMVAADSGDLEPLREMLGSDAIFSPWARRLLADLMSRHQRLVRRRGKQAVPLYGLSRSEAVLKAAAEHYRSHPGSDVAEVAEEFGVSVSTLENYLAGKRGSSNRAKRLRA